MPTDKHQTLDLAKVQNELAAVFETVIKSRQRVEIQGAAAGESAVIISKAELDSIERALQILAETDSYKSMSAALTELISAAQPTAATR